MFLSKQFFFHDLCSKYEIEIYTNSNNTTCLRLWWRGKINYIMYYKLLLKDQILRIT